MKINGSIINNGFWKIAEIEVYKYFIKFNIDPHSISSDLKDVVADIMYSEPYENDDELYLSVIIPKYIHLDVKNAFLHISEISYELLGDYVKKLNEAVLRRVFRVEDFGIKIEFDAVEVINLLSVA